MPTTSIHIDIRAANKNDIPQLCVLRKEFAEYHVQFSTYYALKPEAGELFKSHLNEILSNPSQRVLVAEVNGEIFGYANGYLTNTAAIFMPRKRGYIDEFGITANARGNKIGQQLLNQLLDWFKEQKVERVEVKADALNTGGINFWRKNGFADLAIQMGKTL